MKVSRQALMWGKPKQTVNEKIKLQKVFISRLFIAKSCRSLKLMLSWCNFGEVLFFMFNS